MTDPAGAPVEVPRCYRHPGRETYVRCSRCDRPICPDCMTSASVGFQCPECMAEGVATRPQATTQLGGRPIERPVVTTGVFVVCVAVYLLGAVGVVTEAVLRFSMWPLQIALNGEFYRLITAAFLHGSLLHIGFNMLVLWSVGPTLERILGHGRFLTLYVVAALGGSVASYIFSDPLIPSVGASGAIFGLMGALVVAGRRLGYDIGQVFVLLAINVAIGFVPGSNIDWRAHLGGLVTGALVAAIMAYAPQANRTLWQILGVLAVVGVLVVLTMWRTAVLRTSLLPDFPIGAPAAVSAVLGGAPIASLPALVLPLLAG